MTTRLTPWQTLTCDTAELAALDEVERSRRSGVPVTLTELRREGGAL